MNSCFSRENLKRAIASKGISDKNLKKILLSIVEKKKIQGDLLDFGAGTGEFLQLVISGKKHLINSFSGVDIQPRPQNLPKNVEWFSRDLNLPAIFEKKKFDLITCIEVIEHLENPRLAFRNFANNLKTGGKLILTTPNCESIRSFLCLIFGGHFAAHLGKCYPAHITALLRLDLIRLCYENGFRKPTFFYSNLGSIPKFPNKKWQDISKAFRGRFFSDNLILITEKVS